MQKRITEFRMESKRARCEGGGGHSINWCGVIQDGADQKIGRSEQVLFDYSQVRGVKDRTFNALKHLALIILIWGSHVCFE